MTSITQKTSLIALSVLVMTLGLPSAFAGTGTVGTSYWHDDPKICYTDELDDIEIDGSTGNQSVVETELDKVDNTYNTALNNISSGIDVIAENGSCPSIHYISMESASLGTYGNTAQELTWVYSSDNTRIYNSVVEFTTDKGFGSDVNVCANQNKDIEWTANHEVGHSFGLNHHFDLFIDHSVMEPYCVSSWSTVQSADETALDINH